MAHDHGDSGAGFFAGMSAMMFMLIAVVLVVLLVAAFAWRPWGAGDGDTGPGGGVEETLPGNQPGGTDGGGGTGGTAPGSYRFGTELPSVRAAASALSGADIWRALAA